MAKTRNAVNQFVINDFGRGGISHSPYLGTSKSNAFIANLDISSRQGTIKLTHALEKKLTLSDKPTTSVGYKNYIFVGTETGKLIRINTNDYTTEEVTIQDAEGNSKIISMATYEGFLYITTKNFLHRLDLNKSPSSVELNWQQLGIIHEFGSRGGEYNLKAYLSENEEDKIQFYPKKTSYDALAFYLEQVPSGGIYIDIHTHEKNENTGCEQYDCESICSQTAFFVKHEDLTVGWNYIQLPFSQFIKGIKYDVHIYSTSGDGILATQTDGAMSMGFVRLIKHHNDEYHPFVEQNLVLFLGDGNTLHQIEKDVFSANVLDIPEKYTITSLGKIGTDVVIGTTIDEATAPVQVFRWDTWSKSYIAADEVPEPIISAFANIDNYTILIAGYKPTIYLYNNRNAVKLRDIPGEHDSNTKAIVYKDAATFWQGKAILGVSNIANNPIRNGIYTVDINANRGGLILNAPFMLLDTNDNIIEENVEFISLYSNYPKLFVIVNNNGQYEVYELSTTNRAKKGYIETRILTIDEAYLNLFSRFYVGFEKLPTGTEIKIFVRETPYDTWTELATFTDDKYRKHVVAENKIYSRNLQLRVELISDGSDTPIINNITITGR